MFFLYNVLMAVAGFCLKAIALFSPKIRLFVDGRKDVFQILRSKITTGDKIIWFHAASLGEYEQGIPVMEKVKILYPDHKLLLTFFSPSGFEVRKNNTIADITVYLPWDTISNVRKFLNIARPKLVFFVKYEYWPNYLKELRKRKIDTYLISGIFRENQVFFKWYGGFYRKALDTFNHFFVQNALSKELLLKLGKSNVTVSGDTRFDRVAAILEKDNSLDFISQFKDDKLLVVIGSSWPKDEKLLIEYINAAEADVKFIFAPHNIKEDQIKELAAGLQKKPILFSEKDGKNLRDYSVFIIDTVGILTKIYSYADIAYVGGGFGNPGVHNILEPATFGIPVIIGPNYSHFAEATALVHMGGCLVISSREELSEMMDNLISNEDIRAEKGHICSTFIQMNKNASNIIIDHIKNVHPVTDTIIK